VVHRGVTNTCYNALDRHVDEGRGNQTAVIYDSPVTGTIEKFTFREFRDKVALFAGALQARSVRKGDRVIVYMPMIPEAFVAMLACARHGRNLIGSIRYFAVCFLLNGKSQVQGWNFKGETLLKQASCQNQKKR